MSPSGSLAGAAPGRHGLGTNAMMCFGGRQLGPSATMLRDMEALVRGHPNDTVIHVCQRQHFSNYVLQSSGPINICLRIKRGGSVIKQLLETLQTLSSSWRITMLISVVKVLRSPVVKKLA